MRTTDDLPRDDARQGRGPPRAVRLHAKPTSQRVELFAPAMALVLSVLGVGLGSGCGMNQFLHVNDRALDDGLRVLEGGGGNTLVLLHGPEALVVDPKFMGYSRGLEHEVQRRMGRRVTRIVLTHFHADHTNGAELFPWVGAVLAHPSTRERIAGREACSQRHPGRVEGSGFARSDPAPFTHVRTPELASMCALPYVDVRAEMRLWLGEEIRIVPLSGHTDGDLAVYLPGRKVLAAGDLVLSGWLPHVDSEGGGDPLRMAEALDTLLELPFDRLVPGHGPVAGRAEVELARGYLRVVEAGVRAAMKNGLTSEDAVVEAVPRPPEAERLMPIPGDSHERNVRLMFRAVVEADRKAAP